MGNVSSDSSLMGRGARSLLTGWLKVGELVNGRARHAQRIGAVAHDAVQIAIGRCRER
jgi:hypothetical protein